MSSRLARALHTLISKHPLPNTRPGVDYDALGVREREQWDDFANKLGAAMEGQFDKPKNEAEGGRMGDLGRPVIDPSTVPTQPGDGSPDPTPADPKQGAVE